MWKRSMGGFHIESSLQSWWTKTKDLSLAPFVRPPAFLHCTIFISVNNVVECAAFVILAAYGQTSSSVRKREPSHFRICFAPIRENSRDLVVAWPNGNSKLTVSLVRLVGPLKVYLMLARIRNYDPLFPILYIHNTTLPRTWNYTILLLQELTEYSLQFPKLIHIWIILITSLFLQHFK